MNIIDLRKNLHESAAGQRIADRRRNPYAFGTQEWLDYNRRNGYQCPTHDRRKIKRRACDKAAENGAHSDTPKPYVRILLTPAEKKLLEDLYLTDLD